MSGLTGQKTVRFDGEIACSEWTFLEKYRIDLCDGSLHFLWFCGWLLCLVFCKLQISVNLLHYFILSSLSWWCGGWEKCAKTLHMNY